MKKEGPHFSLYYVYGINVSMLDVEKAFLASRRQIKTNEKNMENKKCL